MYIECIEFNLDFYPISLDNFKTANDMLKCIKQIKITNTSIMFVATYTTSIKPLVRLELCKGIFIIICR